MEPPVPIPNTEVKRCSPDDSASIGRAKVGRRQYLPPLASPPLARGGFFSDFPCSNRPAAPVARGGSFSRPRNFIPRMRGGVLWSRRVRTRSSLSVRGSRPCSGCVLYERMNRVIRFCFRGLRLNRWALRWSDRFHRAYSARPSAASRARFHSAGVRSAIARLPCNCGRTAA